MSNAKREGHIGRKSNAAGGWASLKAVAGQLLASGAPGKSAKALAKLNQDPGFDCPGCAWGDPEHGSSFEFCENGVKAVAWEATSARAAPAFFGAHTVSELKTWEGHELEKAGRLTHPMLYDAATDHYQSIEWDDAFQVIARGLKALPSPEAAAFYTSGRASNEAAFLYQLMVRAFGTNNLPDCSNMCHEASGVALTEQIGIGKGTVRLEDFDQADAIFVWGQNPGSNHPRMLATLRDAAKRGATIVALNPLKERGLESFADPKSPKDMLAGGVDLASHYFCPRPGGDMAVALGMVKALLANHREALDHSFIETHTDGLAALDALASATPWAKIEQQSGLAQAEIEQLAALFAKAERVIFTWAMGLTQHEHSVPMIQMLMNVLLLGGQIGKPGAGACPVRGHSNVQGDRTMGINEAPPEAFLEALGSELDFDVPRAHGVNTVQCIQAMERGEIKAFIGLGGNFAAATPDSARTEQALEGLDLVVNIATKPNRSHLVVGKTTLVLPCLGRTEIDEQAGGPQFITVEDSMSMVHGSAGMNKPAAPSLKSEPAIIAGMANALLGPKPVDWLALVADYDRIRDLIARVVPGFEGFNERVRTPRGFWLGNAAAERTFKTATGKARLTANALPEDLKTDAVAKQAGRPLLNLVTVRSHDQYNTTIYGLDDRYRGVYGMRRVLFTHPADMAGWGVKEGDVVTLISYDTAGQTRQAQGFCIVPYDVPQGSVVSYYPETNGLVPLESHGDRSFTPTSKSIPIEIVPT